MSVSEQSSIPSSRASRVAALAGAGARVGVNYVKHYGKKATGQKVAPTDLEEANAGAIYDTFSRLKGGPLKLAQMLSIDRNMLPEAFREQFAQAQYSAPPLSYPLVVKTFRREFGKEPLALFDTFSKSALHGASIGQVHRASKGKKDFAVKVQYPGVADSLDSDLAVVKPVALQVLGWKDAEVQPYFAEVRERLLEETDYSLELERSVSLSEASKEKIPGIRFPRYYPEYSNRRVLTMDWIEGRPLDRFAAEVQDPSIRNRVAQAIWDFYHFQIHQLKRFHADPHPGNFLVDESGDVVVLDFGCTKQIDLDFHRDYFRFLDPEVVRDRKAFEKGLWTLDILSENDTERERDLILENAQAGAELLGRPFYEGSFDFSDETYMAAIFEMGEAQRKNREWKQIRTARGSADSIYLNRAYFGLYSLMGLLKARIETRRDV
ncbi:MAG: AarF/ABC1/UbiB kinase family protein [Verrucomicrobiales bacterium]|nr:AarF/ABC1/UbiB kinase family protein [Verrucomicrobiales bacterium]